MAGSAWGQSWGDAWGDSWGIYVSSQDAWGDSWGCSWRAAWGHQGCPLPPAPPGIGGGWFNPPDDGHGYDLERIKKDDRDFLNILIMAIHGINKL
jgi:hypothetical protein